MNPAKGNENSPLVIVTGGAGFIGSHLVERLLKDGFQVAVIDDFSTGSHDNLKDFAGHPQIQIASCKISECVYLQEWVKKAVFIYHLAATVGVELVMKSALQVLEDGFDETRVLLRAAADAGTPVLLTSTSEVYGKSSRDSFDEEDDLLIGPPGQPRWSYACSKLADEFMAFAYARERQLPVIIARLFNTVGPRQTGRYGMVLPRFIASAQNCENLKVFGDGLQTRCFCLVHDVVEALVRLQKCPSAAGQVFNIGSTEEISILELARLVVSTLESSSGVEMVPYANAYPLNSNRDGLDRSQISPVVDDMRRRKPSVGKLHHFTGYVPRTSLKEIILITARSLAPTAGGHQGGQRPLKGG